MDFRMMKNEGISMGSRLTMDNMRFTRDAWKPLWFRFPSAAINYAHFLGECMDKMLRGMSVRGLKLATVFWLVFVCLTTPLARLARIWERRFGLPVDEADFAFDGCQHKHNVGFAVDAEDFRYGRGNAEIKSTFSVDWFQLEKGRQGFS